MKKITKKDVKGWFDEGFAGFAEKLGDKLSGLIPSKASDDGGGDLQAKIDRAVEQAKTALTADFAEQIGELSGELKTAREQLASGASTSAKRDIAAFVEKQTREGRWLPAWKQAGAIELMEALAAGGGETIEFTEGEGDEAKTVKRTPLEVFQAFVEGLPKLVEFSELTGHQGRKQGNVVQFNQRTLPGENQELAERAKTLQKEKGISFTEAAELAQTEQAG